MEAPCSLARYSNIATTRPTLLTMEARPSLTVPSTTSLTAMGGAKIEIPNGFMLVEKA